MLDYFQKITIGQYKAALQTLQNCIDECPLEQWRGKVANHSFSQSAFHALFFADIYLGKDLDEFKNQSFHKQHSSEFRDYEELQSKVPENTYTKSFVMDYLEYCHRKVESVVGNETETALKAKSEIPWLEITRGELHIYNIRHIQHHAAQLTMRLRLETNVNIGWVRSG